MENTYKITLTRFVPIVFKIKSRRDLTAMQFWLTDVMNGEDEHIVFVDIKNRIRSYRIKDIESIKIKQC